MKRLVVAAVIALAGMSVVAFQTAPAPAAHFHHVHVNSTDAAKTQQFYQTNFGAQPIKFKGTTDGLFVSRGFILINTVAQTPKSIDTTSIRHIGWAGIDGPSEFEGFKKRNLPFHTPLTALGQNWFFYIFGPDREVAEVYTGDQNHLFNHVHFSVNDLNATASWYQRMLGATFPASASAPKPTDPAARWGTQARVDGVSLVYIYKDHYYADSEVRLPVGRALQTTAGSAFDHIAFSYERIEPELERMRAAGAQILQPIAQRPEGVKSFFVQAPDGVVIEIVEARPIPDGLWQ